LAWQSGCAIAGELIHADMIIAIPARQITDWDSFQAVLGFPDFYGRNMDAWIDCMSYLDEPSSGMTSVPVKTGELVALRIDERRCLEQYDALIECTAFVNLRRIHVGEKPLLTLMLSGWFRDRPSIDRLPALAQTRARATEF
jgi:barstar (barnase inhibitor)